MALSFVVQEFCDDIKVARELVVVGNYSDASVYYEGAMSMMQRHIGTLVDHPERKTKCQKVRIIHMFIPFNITIGKFIYVVFYTFIYLYTCRTKQNMYSPNTR